MTDRVSEGSAQPGAAPRSAGVPPSRPPQVPPEMGPAPGGSLLQERGPRRSASAPEAPLARRAIYWSDEPTVDISEALAEGIENHRPRKSRLWPFWLFRR